MDAQPRDAAAGPHRRGRLPPVRGVHRGGGGGAIRVRRGRPSPPNGAGAALLPLTVWLFHGSVDWFWEMPALSGPALGFMGWRWALAAGSFRRGTHRLPGPGAGHAAGVGAWVAAGVIALVSRAVVLGFPYLSVREQASAAAVRRPQSSAALDDLADARQARSAERRSGPHRRRDRAAERQLQRGDHPLSASRSRGSPAAGSPGLGAGWPNRRSATPTQARQRYAMAASINKRDTNRQAGARPRQHDPPSDPGTGVQVAHRWSTSAASRALLPDKGCKTLAPNRYPFWFGLRAGCPGGDKPRSAVGATAGKERMRRITILEGVAIALLAIPSAALAQGKLDLPGLQPAAVFFARSEERPPATGKSSAVHRSQRSPACWPAARHAACERRVCRVVSAGSLPSKPQPETGTRRRRVDSACRRSPARHDQLVTSPPSARPLVSRIT